jgi:hypothetical protein
MNIFNYLIVLIVARNEDHFAWAKIGAIDTVSNPVNVHQFSVHSNGIDTAEEQIRAHLRFSHLKAIFFLKSRLPMVIEGVALCLQ